MTDTSTFKAFVFPRPNYVFSRSATVSLDNEHMTVTDRHGVEVFRSALDDLKLGADGAYLSSLSPYNLFWGPNGSMVRLGFRSGSVRTFMLLLGFVATTAVLGTFGRANEIFNFALAGCVMGPALWAVRRLARTGDKEIFESRLLELKPSLAERETVPFQYATTAVGRAWLLLYVAFWVFVGSAAIAMLASLAFRPDAPTPDPEGVAFRVTIWVLAALALSFQTYRYLKPYRPWSTAEFGGYSNIVNIVMVPLLLILVLAVIAVGRQITGL